MSGAIAVKFEHVPEFDKALDDWVARVEKAAGTALKAAGAEIAKETQASFGTSGGPVRRSGALAGSVVTSEPAKSGSEAWEVTVGPQGLAYVRRVELGKKGRHSAAPHPYFKPALGRAGSRFEEVFRAAWAAAQP